MAADSQQRRSSLEIDSSLTSVAAHFRSGKTHLNLRLRRFSGAAAHLKDLNFRSIGTNEIPAKQ
jgi:hypothetical protein